jgi:hypothetical protein
MAVEMANQETSELPSDPSHSYNAHYSHDVNDVCHFLDIMIFSGVCAANLKRRDSLCNLK